LFLKLVSHTFHGRDIFAPVGAHLSRGVSMRELGPGQKDFIRLPWPKPRVRRGSIEGEIVYIDRFGNAITNIACAHVGTLRGWKVFAGRRRLCEVKAFYQSVGPGQSLAVPGSSGFLEIAVNGGSAAEELGLGIGDGVDVRRATPAD
jgi:S-adenosylmethionine hydrolase